MSIHQDWSASKDDSNCPSSFTWVIHKSQTRDNALQDKDLHTALVLAAPIFVSKRGGAQNIDYHSMNSGLLWFMWISLLLSSHFPWDIRWFWELLGHKSWENFQFSGKFLSFFFDHVSGQKLINIRSCIQWVIVNKIEPFTIELLIWYVYGLPLLASKLIYNLSVNICIKAWNSILNANSIPNAHYHLEVPKMVCLQNDGLHFQWRKAWNYGLRTAIINICQMTPELPSLAKKSPRS